MPVWSTIPQEMPEGFEPSERLPAGEYLCIITHFSEPLKETYTGEKWWCKVTLEEVVPGDRPGRTIPFKIQTTEKGGAPTRNRYGEPRWQALRKACNIEEMEQVSTSELQFRAVYVTVAPFVNQKTGDKTTFVKSLDPTTEEQDEQALEYLSKHHPLDT